MTKKVKFHRDNSVTVILNGRDNSAFWTAVDNTTEEWIGQGYRLTYVEKGANIFKDSILTSLRNMICPFFHMKEKHDPIVKLTFAK